MKAATRRTPAGRACSPVALAQDEVAFHRDQADDRGECAAGTVALAHERVSFGSALAGICFLLGLLMLSLGAIWSGASAPLGCRASPGGLVFGIDTHVALGATAGVWCRLRLDPPAATIDDIAIVSPPHSGVATTDHQKAASYRASPGFHGEDAFTLAIRGHSRIYTGTSIVRVDVTID